MSAPKSTAESSLLIADLFSVKGKNVLVTGGGRGIGLMIAEGFVRNGANVFISSRDEKTISAVAAALTAVGPGTCTAFAADLSNLAGVEVVSSRLRDVHGLTSLHVLVNNSGASWGEPLETFSEKGCLLPLLSASATASDPSRVINIGSVTGIHHQSVQSWSYDVSKAAVHHLTRKLAEHVAPRHITVNAIAPGYVPSKMSRTLPVSLQDIAASLPLRRVGTAEDMAGVALLLSSRAGAWMTGVTVPVDGGGLTISRL